MCSKKYAQWLDLTRASFLRGKTLQSFTSCLVIEKHLNTDASAQFLIYKPELNPRTHICVKT